MSQTLTDIDLSPSHATVRTAPPRVLILDHTAKMGGGEIALLNLVRHLDAARFHSVVLLLSDGPLRERLAESGIESHVLPLPSSIINARKDGLGLAALLKVSDIAASLAFCHRLARWIRQQQIELIHTNSLKADLLGGIAGRLARVPVIWHVRDRISNDYLPSKVVRAFRLASRVLPSVIVANSAATLQTLRPNHKSKAPCHRWRVVHDGTPFLPLPTPVLTDANAPLVVGIVGRISPWKGQHIFLQAAALARHAFPNVRFRIIGAPLFSESEYEQSLHALGHELGLTDVIDFAGFREDVSNAISELDVLVHASTIGEPFGQVVIEAMMLGRPVIATRGGGVPEIVADGKTGLLVPMDDVHAMAGALKSLLSDPQLRANMGRAGRQRVLEHFRIETVAANISTLYDELLSA